MSKLTVDANEAAGVAARLLGAKLLLKDQGFHLDAPGLDVKIDMRRVVLEGVIQKGPLSIDLKNVEIAEQGITLNFTIQ